MDSPQRRRAKLQKNHEENLVEKQRREEEKQLEEKMELLRYEFEKSEKHKQTHTNTLLNSEIQLKNMLNELRNANNIKRTSANGLYDQIIALDRFTVSSLELGANGSEQNFNSTRQSIRKSMVSPDGAALQERIVELRELSNTLSEQIEEEKYQTEVLERKIGQLVQDNDIYKERMNIAQRLLHHAIIRFQNLGRIDYVASVQKTESSTHFTAFNNSIKKVEDYESEHLKTLQQQQEDRKIQLKQANRLVSKSILDRDQAIKTNEELISKVQALDEENHEDSKNKPTTAEVLRALSIFEKLFQFLEGVNSEKDQNLQTQSETNSAAHFSDSPSTVKPNKFRNSQILMKLRAVKSFQPVNSAGASPLKLHPEPNSSGVSLRTNYIFSVTQFYKAHQGGPNRVVDEILKAYHEFLYHEGSMQMAYKELGSMISKKEKELGTLLTILRRHQYENKQDETLTAAQPQSAEQVAVTSTGRRKSSLKSSSIISKQLFERTTLYIETSRAKVALPIVERPITSERDQSIEHAVEEVPTFRSDAASNEERSHQFSEKQLNALYSATEETKNKSNKYAAFVLTLYLTLIELIYRICKLLVHVGDIGIGYFPIELDKFGNEQLAIISEIRGIKSADNPVNEFQNTQYSWHPTNHSHAINPSTMGGDISENTNSRDENTILKDDRISLAAAALRKEHGISNLTLDDVMDAFIKQFDVDQATAKDFASKIRTDLYIQGFVSKDEFNSYLNACSENNSKPGEAIEKAFENVNLLQSKAVMNLQTKFQSLFKMICDIILKLLEFKNETSIDVSDPQKELVGPKPTTPILNHYSDFVSKVQEKIALRICDYFDTAHPSIHKDPRKPLVFKNKKAQVADLDELNGAASENQKIKNTAEDVKNRIKQLLAQILEKKRGYFHKKVTYLGLKSLGRTSNMAPEPSIVGPKNEDEYMELERRRIRTNNLGNSEENRILRSSSQLRQRRAEGTKVDELSLSITQRPKTSSFAIPKKYRPDEEKLRMIHNSIIMGKVNSIGNYVKSQTQRKHIPSLVDDLIPLSVLSAKRDLRLQRIPDSEIFRTKTESALKNNSILTADNLYSSQELRKIVPSIRTPGKTLMEYFSERNQTKLEKEFVESTSQRKKGHRSSRTPNKLRALSRDGRPEARKFTAKRQMLIRSVSRGNFTSRNLDINDQLSSFLPQEPFKTNSFFTTTYCAPTYHEFATLTERFN